MFVYRMIWNEISLSHDSTDVLGAFRVCLQTHFIICSVHTRFPKTSTWLNKRAKQKQKRHSQFEKRQQQQQKSQPQQTVVIYFKMKYWSSDRCGWAEKVNEYSLSGECSTFYFNLIAPFNSSYGHIRLTPNRLWFVLVRPHDTSRRAKLWLPP